MKVCHFQLGEPVQISLPNLDPVVRIVWPTKDSETTAVPDNGKKYIPYIAYLSVINLDLFSSRRVTIDTGP